MRGVLAAVLATLGYVCVTQTLAQVVMNGDAALAHRMAPDNGRVSARLAATLSGPGASSADRKRADLLAREALLQDATAVFAVATLGANAEVRGERDQARRLFTYSQKLSRRVLPTQLWAIEEAVAREDVAEALHQYDIALRTSSKGAGLLFPVLASAIADPAIRVALVKTLANDPNWGEGFITYLTSHGPDPRTTAELFLSLRLAGVVVPESARAPIINALIDKGLLEEAWRHYSFAIPGVDRRSSRDPQFVVDTESPSLFDWRPINDGGVTTSIQRGEDGGVFYFAAPASVGGPLLQQMQLLPPGIYHLAGHSSGIQQEERARPYWVLSCRQDGRELGRVPLTNSTQESGRFAGSFGVPTNCPAQMLTLVGRPSDALAGLSGQIDHVQLAPAR